MTPTVLILTVLFAALAWRDLKSALLLLVGILPIYLLRVSWFGIPSTALELFILVFTAVWIIRGVRPKFFSPLRIPITLILLAAVIGVIVAPNFSAALGILKAYIVEPLIVFVAASSIFTRDDIPHLFRALGISAAVLAIIAILQALTGYGIPVPWDIERRATSVFPYPNALGLFLAPIVAAFAFLPRNAWRVIVIGLGIAGIILAKTEAAFVAVPSAILIVSFWSATTKRSRAIHIAIVVILLVGALAIPTAREKILLQDWSGQVRLSQWSETWQMLTDTPQHFFFGAGLSGYPTALAPYHQDTWLEIFQYPHNIFLNVWTELGIIGLIGLIGLIGPIFRATQKNKRDPFTLAASAALLAMFIHGLVDVPYFKNDLAVLTWIFVAALLIASSTDEKIASSDGHNTLSPKVSKTP